MKFILLYFLLITDYRGRGGFRGGRGGRGYINRSYDNRQNDNYNQQNYSHQGYHGPQQAPPMGQQGYIG